MATAAAQEKKIVEEATALRAMLKRYQATIGVEAAEVLGDKLSPLVVAGP